MIKQARIKTMPADQPATPKRTYAKGNKGLKTGSIIKRETKDAHGRKVTLYYVRKRYVISGKAREKKRVAHTYTEALALQRQLEAEIDMVRAEARERAAYERQQALLGLNVKPPGTIPEAIDRLLSKADKLIKLSMPDIRSAKKLAGLLLQQDTWRTAIQIAFPDLVHEVIEMLPYAQPSECALEQVAKKYFDWSGRTLRRKLAERKPVTRNPNKKSR